MALADLLPPTIPTPGIALEDEETRRQREEEERLAAGGAAPLQVTDSATGGGSAPLVTPAAAAPVVYQPPESSTRVEGGQSTSKRTEFTPQFREQIDTQKATNNVAADAKAREGQASVDKAGVEEQKAAAEAELAAKHAQDLANAREEQNKLIEAKRAEYAGRRAQLEKDAKITTYWQDRGAAAEIFAHFITGISDYSHQLNGGEGPSPVQRMMDQKFAEDRAAKLQKFETSKFFVDLAGKDVEAAEKAKAAKEAEIKDQHVVMRDALGKRFASYAAKIGTPEAQAKADRELAEMQSKNAKEIADQEKLANREVSYTGPKTTTTTNVNAKKDDTAAKTPSIPDVEKRNILMEQEKSTRELQRIALNNPFAIQQVQNAIRKFGAVELGGMAGAAGDIVPRILGRPTTADEALKDADPDARMAFSLIQGMIATEAKLRGGAITEGDEKSVTKKLALLGRSPKEIAHAASDAADAAVRQRQSMEAVRNFPDKAPDRGIPSDDEDQRAAESRKERATATEVKQAVEDVLPANGMGRWLARPNLDRSEVKALGDLLTALKSGGDVEAAAKAAKESGVRDSLVDALVEAKKKKK